MAVSYDNTKTTVTVKHRDRNGESKQSMPTALFIGTDPATDWIGFAAQIADIAAKRQALSDSVVREVEVTIKFVDVGAALVGTEDSNQIKGRINLLKTGDEDTMQLLIPNPKAAIRAGASGSKDWLKFDKNNAALVNFVGLYQATGGILKTPKGGIASDSANVWQEGYISS